MDIRAKPYQKIVILQVTGLVTVPEVTQLAADIPKVLDSFLRIVFVISDAQLDEAGVTELFKLRDTRRELKPSLIVVHPDLKEADARDISEALDNIANPEAERLLKLFEKGHELAKMRDELAGVNKHACELMNIPGESKPEERELAAARVHDENRKLRYLIKSLENEINALKKQRAQAGAASLDIDAETKRKLDKGRKAAIAIMKEHAGL